MMKKKKTHKHNYNKPCYTNLYRFVFRFRKDKYPQVAEKLESVESKTGYIRELIRLDVKYNLIETLHDVEYQANECAWCHEKFDESELTLTNIGRLCDTCMEAIKSRGEPITIIK